MSSEQNEIDRTKNIIRMLTKKVKVGEVYDATVVRVEKFGAFVELFHGKEALVHISQLQDHRVNEVADVVTVGDKMKVKVTDVDLHDRIKASHKALLEHTGSHSRAALGSRNKEAHTSRAVAMEHSHPQKNPQFVIKQKD